MPLCPHFRQNNPFFNTLLEDRRQSLLTRLGEANKGIRRIVEYIKSHDTVPAHIDKELTKSGNSLNPQSRRPTWRSRFARRRS